ncbi:MAG TPA: DEAD/DEAH box helicase, partial [Candidatus Sulfotelmatobacter sp.]|nr:DEAD/DEAH box helicase [Candidatus Sulfotelmatobacter sp.]
MKLWEGQKWRRLLLTCATGLGKTVIFCHTAKAMNARTLILAHRDELCSQAAVKMEAIWPEAGVGIVKADKNQVLAQVVVASVQTLARPERLAQMPRFDLIIVDEAHHAPAKTYRDILKALGAWEPDGPLVVGVTATPKRADDLGLDSVFQKVAYSKGLLEGIREGYLTDLVGKRIKADLDLSGIKLVAGDYDERQLAQAVNREAFNNLVVEAYKREAPGRLAVVFTCSVEHAQAVAEAFCAAGIPAAHVDGEMKESKRKAVLDDFHHGRLRVITNCQLLTEGWDEPAIDCVIMARPTRSQTLYIQAVGRGARPFPGKEN